MPSGLLCCQGVRAWMLGYPVLEEQNRELLLVSYLNTEDADEINEVLCKIQDFHGKAYQWTPNLSAASLAASTQSGGYLLRTKIRAAIEFLDQLYQYGKAGNTTVNELGIKREICRHPRGCVPARNPGGFSLRAERSL